MKKKQREVFDLTYQDLKGKLSIHGKCALVRPTGFGKTFMLTNLLKGYNKVLYLYPAEVIRQTVEERYAKDEDLDHVHFVTYSALVRMTEDDMKCYRDVDLIIADEMHRTGADRTSLYLRQIINVLKLSHANFHFVGATATPERQDSFDVVDEFFNNIVVFPYRLHDAIKDGLLIKPYYVYANYKLEESQLLEDETIKGALAEVDTWGTEEERFQILEQLTRYTAEHNKLVNIPEILKKHINIVKKGNVDYLKFIVFTSSKKTMKIDKEEVVAWFEEAFPSHKIRTLTITSDKVNAKNVAKLDSFTTTSGTIDLIFCINMLNMGYHIPDITGIVMKRDTFSNIIYSQQLGRCLSVDAKYPAIVFDFVNNINKKAIFETNTQRKNKKKEPKDTSLEWLEAVNVIEEGDITVIDEEAGFKEIVKKVDAEPLLMRRRRAYNLYKNKFVNGLPNMPMEVAAKYCHVTVRDIMNEIEADYDNRLKKAE